MNTTTTYGYNLQTGVLEWVKGPKDTDATRTEYTYDPDTFLLEEVSAAVGDQTMWAEYTYDDGLLTGLETPTTVYSFDYGVFNLRQSIKIGGRTLISYSYTPNNYLISRMTYGNNDFVEYDYDAYGRVLSETYEDGDTVTYHYDNDGALVAVTDEAAQITTRQYFDLSGRNVGYSEIGTDFTHRVGYTYNTDNNLTEQVENINGTETVSSYTYDDDNRVTELTTDGVTVAYTYDGFGRVSQQVTKIKAQSEEAQDTVLLTEVFTFNDTQTLASTQVQSYKTYKGTVSDENLRAEYHYTYDENGNITSVFNGSTWVYYTYDSANQLIREDNQAAQASYKWTYDNAGNILKVEEFAYTAPETELGTDNTPVNYTYGRDTWGDMLTTYNGTQIYYEGSGNPTLIGDVDNLSDPDNVRFIWEHGRQLASMSKDGTVWNYSYNNAGLRTGRTGGNTTYKYVYSGGLLMQMTKNNQTVDFTYDLGSRPLTMKVGGSTYYYVTNVQGDVMALLDADGDVVVRYRYTAYGVAEITTGANTTAANFNPLTYRGYVYDAETELYYLQSRYYDPELGRFINADSLMATGQGLTGNNMFTYCLNNPVTMVDNDGHDAIFVVAYDYEDGLPLVGHSYVLYEDAEGTWRKTEYARNKKNGKIEIMDYKADAALVERMKRNQIVYNAEYYYIKGDFTTCEEYAKNIKPKYDGKYDVGRNNCADYAKDALMQGNFANQMNKVALNVFDPMAPKDMYNYIYDHFDTTNPAAKRAKRLALESIYGARYKPSKYQPVTWGLGWLVDEHLT